MYNITRSQTILNMVKDNQPKECSNPNVSIDIVVEKRTKTAQLLMNSANLQPPACLISLETSTFGLKDNFLSSDSLNVLKEFRIGMSIRSDYDCLVTLPNNLTTPHYAIIESDKVVETNYLEQQPSTSKNNIYQDLYLSSDTDPFYDGDDSHSDKDFVPEEDEDKQPVRIPRKKKRNDNNWKRNVIKMSRNSGRSYENWKGKIQADRKLKGPCTTCRNKCTEKFTEEERRKILNDYWNLGDINRQRDFISKCVKFNKKERCRKKKRNGKEKDANTVDSEDADQENYEPSRRNCTFVYCLPKAGTNIQICKTFFLNTLCISAQTVRTVYHKTGSSGIVLMDMRGKVCKNSQIDESIKQTVRNHINSFETVESHYCRKNTTRVYLPPTLNIAKMFSLYQEYCEENNVSQKATESMYRSIFNSEFNMSFFKPKKDLCDTCHKYDNSSVEAKLELEEEYQLHVRNKKMGRALKETDKEKAIRDSSFCAATFDLQQILSVPKSDVGLAYYKLKLSAYNFTVYNLASKDCFCYMWYESIAKRGAAEIGSSLLLFIQHHVKKGVKQFSFYSDNCPGQNRNKFLFSLYNYLSQIHKIKIQHSFLERGHTQTEGDSVHSVIEKAARFVPIYTPEQWYTIVRTAKRKQPYIVVELAQENVYDLKALQKETTLNWDRNEENDKVYWNTLKIVQINPEFPNILFYKCSYDEDEPLKKMILIQRGRKSMTVKVPDISLKRLYSEKIPISKKKYDHLQFLCQKKVILSQYHDFFKNLTYTAAVPSEESDSN